MAGIMAAVLRRAIIRTITFRLRGRSSTLRAAKLAFRTNGAALPPTSVSTALALRRGAGSRPRASGLVAPIAHSTLPLVGAVRSPKRSRARFCGRAATWAFARLRAAVPISMLRSRAKRCASRAGLSSFARFAGSGESFVCIYFGPVRMDGPFVFYSCC